MASSTRRYFRSISTKVRSEYNTRNQVVSQEARGFESHPVRQKRSLRLVAGASLLEYLEGIRTGAVVNGAPGALQSREAASAAAEVESHPVRQNRIAILTR